jgi:hypothetical protein
VVEENLITLAEDLLLLLSVILAVELLEVGHKEVTSLKITNLIPLLVLAVLEHTIMATEGLMVDQGWLL